MAKIALGWLGWSEYQTLHSDVNAIELAYEGHVERLKAIHGSPEDNTQARFRTPPKQKGRVMPQHTGATPRQLTPAAFDAAFGTRQKKTITISSPFKREK